MSSRRSFRRAVSIVAACVLTASSIVPSTHAQTSPEVILTLPPAGDTPYFRRGYPGTASVVTDELRLVNTGLPTGPWLLANGTVDVTHYFAVAGGSPPYTFSVQRAPTVPFTFPTATTSDSAEVAQGTFTAQGAYPAEVVVTDSAGASVTTGQFQIQVIDQSSNSELAISGAVPSETITLPADGSGVSKSYPVSVAGGTPPYSFSVVNIAGNYPLGFSDPSASPNALAGTFTTAGSFVAAVKVTDSVGNQAQTGAFATTVRPALQFVQPLTLPSGTLTLVNGSVNSTASVSVRGGTGSYTFSFANTGTPAAPYSFSTTGGTGSGTKTNTLSAHFTTAGSYSGKVIVSDGVSTIQQAFSVTVAGGTTSPLAIVADNPSQDQQLNVQTDPVTVTFSALATGGRQPYTFYFVDAGTQTEDDSLADFIVANPAGTVEGSGRRVNASMTIQGFRDYSMGPDAYWSDGIYRGKLRVVDADGNTADTETRSWIVTNHLDSNVHFTDARNWFSYGWGPGIDMGTVELGNQELVGFTKTLTATGGEMPYTFNAYGGFDQLGVYGLDENGTESPGFSTGDPSKRSTTFTYRVGVPGDFYPHVEVNANNYSSYDTMMFHLRVVGTDTGPMVDGGDITSWTANVFACKNLNVSGGQQPYTLEETSSPNLNGAGYYYTNIYGSTMEICGTFNSPLSDQIGLRVTDAKGRTLDITRSIVVTGAWQTKKLLRFCGMETFTDNPKVTYDANGKLTYEVWMFDRNSDGVIDSYDQYWPVKFCSDEQDVNSSTPITPLFDFVVQNGPQYDIYGYAQPYYCNAVCFERAGHPELVLGTIYYAHAFTPVEGTWNDVVVRLQKNDMTEEYVSDPFNIIIHRQGS